ncbi:zinc-dependent alcohol dehydrogenase family protein [Bacillus sp. NP157]|nr:zinc-dependent alcohol dehydrogenase family protein [Bacillus sp. NP157]
MTTMRALLLNSYEDGTLTDTQITRPVPGVGEVLVRVVASGVNPVDLSIRKGTAPYAMPELPAVLGCDMAGVVADVGEGVSAFKVGDEVYGMTGGVRGLQGSLAEYQVVDADFLAIKPSKLSMRQAAAIPLVFLTAWEGLVDAAAVQPGQTVLVQGGAGGVGHMAVQIARARGARVFATASEGKRDLVETLGATFINYNTEKVADFVARHTGGVGFDVVYDTVGGSVLDQSMLAIKPHGHIVSCCAFGQYTLAPGSFRCMTLSGVFVILPMLSGKQRSHQGAILAEATRMVDADALMPILDPRTFDLSQAMAAHAVQASGKLVGKLVIDVR